MSKGKKQTEITGNICQRANFLKLQDAFTNQLQRVQQSKVGMGGQMKD